MTNQEAIAKLSKMRNLRGAAEAVELTIQALREKEQRESPPSYSALWTCPKCGQYVTHGHEYVCESARPRR